MNIILAIDPNPTDLEHLAQCLSKAYPESKVLTYTDPLLAFQYAYNHKVDAVFTVVQMRRLDGLQLARMVREIQPDTLIYFTGSNAKERNEARRLGVAGYFVKPVSPKAILRGEQGNQRKGAKA